MSKKDNNIEIGSLWREKDFLDQRIYIVTDIIPHRLGNGSVILKRVDAIDSGITINIGSVYLKLDYQKVV